MSETHGERTKYDAILQKTGMNGLRTVILIAEQSTGRRLLGLRRSLNQASVTTGGRIFLEKAENGL